MITPSRRGFLTLVGGGLVTATVTEKPIADARQQLSGVWTRARRSRTATSRTWPAAIPDGTRPTGLAPDGTPYVTYESLYVAGDTVTAALARLRAPAVVTFPAGRFEQADFTAGYQGSINIPKMCRGIIGSGRGTLGGSTGTVFAPTPYSASASTLALLPAQGSGTSYSVAVLKQLDGSGPLHLANFRVEGTAQGVVPGQSSRWANPREFCYSGLNIYHPGGNVTIRNVLAGGWVGDDGAPPGETFGIAINGGAGPTAYRHLIESCEADGRRVLGGPPLGAAGIWFGNCVNSIMRRNNTHHTRYGSTVLFQTFNSQLISCTFGSSADPSSAWPFNCEYTSGNVVTDPIFTKGQASGGVHVTHSNYANQSGSGTQFTMTRNGVFYDATNGNLKVINPRWNGISYGPELWVESWTLPGDSQVTPPLVTQSDGTTHVPYRWAHGASPHVTVS